MKYVDINSVTAFAMTICKGKDLADRNIWREWCYECVKDLGMSDDEIRVCTLYPKNGVAKLPDECRQIIELSLFDSADGNLLHQFRPGNTRIFNDARVSPVASAGNTTNTTANSSIPVDVSNDMYNIHLGTNGDNVAKILIRYFAYPVDEVTNLPLIREDDRMACAYFIRFMESLRSNDNRSEIEQNKLLFFQEADRARARKKCESLTYDKAKTLLKDMMRLVPINDLSKY